MREELAEKIEKLYYAVRDIPYHNPEKFTTFVLRSKEEPFLKSNEEQSLYKDGGRHYSHIFTRKKTPYFKGFKGRYGMWDDKILPAYYGSGLEEITKEDDLKINISNHFLKSKIRIKGKDIYLRIWSPIFSTIFSFLFGNRIKARLKKKNKL